MKLKQLICLLLAALLLGACGSPAAPTEATEETKPTDAGLDPVVPSDAVESSEKPEPVEDLTVPDQTAAVGGANFALGLLRGAAEPDAHDDPLAVFRPAGPRHGRKRCRRPNAGGDGIRAWRKAGGSECLACFLPRGGGRRGRLGEPHFDRESLQLLPEFQKAVEQNYGAEVHAGEISAAAINEWVSEDTKGRIKKLLEQDNEAIQTYLINAMTFDAEWASPYEPEACKEGTFHASDGREQTATYLYSEERSYLEVAGATGFVKHYSGGRYSFAGLLPAEGSTRRLCWRHLTARRCCRQSVIRNRKRSTRVCRNLPLRPRQSSSRCWSVWACRRPLRTLRISALLSDTPLKIDAVQQKTYLQVDESGTIGAAVTSLSIMATTAVETEPPKYVELTRTLYVCVIFDHETQSIVFLGL